jgi:hypothetical protein
MRTAIRYATVLSNVVTWDYTTLEDFSKKKVGISIEIDAGGVVRNVQRIVEYGP